RVALWSRKWRVAIRFADRVLRIYPRQTEALLIKAIALKNEGRTDDARELAKDILILAPENPEAEGLMDEMESLYERVAIVSYYHEFFSSSKLENAIMSAQVDQSLGYRANVRLEVEYRDLYGSHDVAVLAGMKYRLSKALYSSAQLLVGPSTQTAQRISLNIEADYALLRQASVIAGYQYMKFPSLEVNILSPAVSYYFSGDSWILLKAYFSKSSIGTSNSFMGQGNVQLNKSVTIRLGGFTGADFYRQFSETYLANIRATGYFMELKYFFTDLFGIQIDTGHSRWSTGIENTDLSVSAIYRW
ncbi:MAG: YaiO family outer membrane beta-barrel protein, partial [Bacteroidetes bacterium]|nr:YaiO family outer membrane beta-barrel protein [Bacteroidota bacterium]